MLNDKLVKNISFAGGENVGGVQHSQFYLARLDWFLSIKKTKTRDTAVTAAELVTISDSHTFNTGYGFIQVTATMKTGNLESKSAGDLDGKVKNDVVSFAIAGSKASQLAFEKDNLNEDLILLITEIDGTVRQIGSAEIPARMETTNHSIGGGGFDGKKGSTYEVHGWGAGSAPIYTGAITLMP